MKTTVELPDTLVAAAKARARRDGTSLRVLLTDGLRRVLDDDEHAGGAYRYVAVTSDGDGTPLRGVDLSDWAGVRALIYEDDT